MKPFRTIEVSDPRFESGGLRFITVKSVWLKGRGDICVYVPGGIPEGQSLPVVVLLHGVYGSAWSWSQQGGVHLRAAGMIREGVLPPMIIAMPSDGLWGDGSGYLPHGEVDFEKWIVEDVVNAVRWAIPAARQDVGLFIGGLSMGGYGALLAGVKYHDLFDAISVHSAITSLDQMKLFVEEGLGSYQQADAGKQDVLATCLLYKGKVPSLRFDCGREDLLIDYNRVLHRGLEAAGIDHEYREYEGGHEWAYWEEHVAESLLFFARVLREGGKLRAG
ncbi:MAG TPA: alpha/beta hydrolase-fold protein [Puia sp.]|jgi:enterochelin esterase-like enzyme